MRALVTRPREDAIGITADLTARGLDVVVEPLLEIHDAGTIPDLSDVQAYLVTSANGARALAKSAADRARPVYAVGDASARACAELGFGDIHSASGDVEALAALVSARARPENGILYHAAASDVAGDLAGALNRAGFKVRREVLYRAVTAESLSLPTQRLLAAEEIDLALFFSPRTAQTFVTLLSKADLVPSCGQMTAFCLSAAVGKALRPVPWRAIRVAARPEQASLLAAIDHELGSLRHD